MSPPWPAPRARHKKNNRTHLDLRSCHANNGHGGCSIRGEKSRREMYHPHSAVSSSGVTFLHLQVQGPLTGCIDCSLHPCSGLSGFAALVLLMGLFLAVWRFPFYRHHTQIVLLWLCEGGHWYEDVLRRASVLWAVGVQLLPSNPSVDAHERTRPENVRASIVDTSK